MRDTTYLSIVRFFFLVTLFVLAVGKGTGTLASFVCLACWGC